MKTEDFKALNSVDQHCIAVWEQILTELRAIRQLLQMEQP
jgi:hypothetical protein